MRSLSYRIGIGLIVVVMLNEALIVGRLQSVGFSVLSLPAINTKRSRTKTKITVKLVCQC